MLFFAIKSFYLLMLLSWTNGSYVSEREFESNFFLYLLVLLIMGKKIPGNEIRFPGRKFRVREIDFPGEKLREFLNPKN